MDDTHDTMNTPQFLMLVGDTLAELADGLEESPTIAASLVRSLAAAVRERARQSDKGSDVWDLLDTHRGRVFTLGSRIENLEAMLRESGITDIEYEGGEIVAFKSRLVNDTPAYNTTIPLEKK